MTLKDIAKFLNVGWDLVKDIVKSRLARLFSNPPLRNTRYIAIDELNTPPAKAGGFPLATKVAFRLKPV